MYPISPGAVVVRVAGKRKNFRLLYLTKHTSEIVETKVCRVTGGVCGHEAYAMGLKNGLGQLWNRKIWNLFPSVHYNSL